MKTNELLRKILNNIPDLSDESLRPIVKWIEGLDSINSIVTQSNKLMFTEGSYKFSIFSSVIESNNKSNDKVLEIRQFLNNLEKCNPSKILEVRK